MKILKHGSATARNRPVARTLVTCACKAELQFDPSDAFAETKSKTGWVVRCPECRKVIEAGVAVVLPLNQHLS